MPKLKELQGVLAGNVERLRKEFAPDGQRTMNRFAKYCGIGNSALQALKDATGDPKLSTICTIASRFGMEPWHLLIQGATPRAKPRILLPQDDERLERLQELQEEIEDLRSEIGNDQAAIPLTPRAIPRRVAHRRRKT